MAGSKSIEWVAPEHRNHSEKTNDWFWAVGIVAVAGAVLAIFFSNLLFALVILLSAFAAILQAHAKPQLLEYSITRRGVKIGEMLYPYSSLESFWVIDEDGVVEDRILIKSKKMFMPLLILPFDSTEIPADMVREYLIEYMNEEEMEESLIQLIMERFGF